MFHKNTIKKLRLLKLKICTRAANWILMYYSYYCH